MSDHHLSLSSFVHAVADKFSEITGIGHEDEPVKSLRVVQGEQDRREDDEDGNPLINDADNDGLEDVKVSLAALTEYANIKPSRQFICGPVLRFQDMDVNTRVWSGSVLVVSDNDQEPPRLIVHDVTKPRAGASRGKLLDTWEGRRFYRYEVQLSLLEHREKRVEYWFESDRSQKWNFHLPALDEGLNWAFYSCNGFTSDVEDPETNFHGANPLWDDLLVTHDANPFHVMVGGGDQIYNDDVLATPEMVEWLNLDHEERLNISFNNEKKYAVEKFYCDHYIQHYTTGSYSKALSLVPSVNAWDDHDIFDGYGSYPPEIQLSSVMQGIGAAAAKFYLLFQQHTTAFVSGKAGLLTSGSGKGYQTITHFGRRTLVLLPDTRSERSKETILSNETYDLLDREVRRQLLPTTRHLVVVLGTPLVYPQLTLAEDTLETMGDSLSRQSTLGRMFGKFKAFENVLGQFGPELLDDLVDSWACEIHKEEKKRFVELLQAIAVQRNVRVTFVGGDVHIGGAGRLFGTESVDPRRDPYEMAQIVSSAIVNGPPPGAVISTLHSSAETYKLNEFTSEQMIDLFTTDVDGAELENKKLLNRRNWCEVHELDGESLEFTIRVENVDHVGTKSYPILVNKLFSEAREQ